MDPQEFILYLKRKYANPYKSGQAADEEFYEITKKEMNKYDISVEEASHKGLDWVLNEIYDGIICQLDLEVKNNIKRCIAVGVVETGEVNAFIAKGGLNTYGIIVNSGLMIFLHKAFKLVLASINPKGITYCNRKRPSEINQKEYSSMFNELCDIYVETGVPRGPMLKLTEELLGKHSQMLHLAEAFVFCHEIAHFLNGDLDDQGNFIILGQDKIAMKYIEGKNHDIEYKADIKAYEILSNYMNANYPEIPNEVRMIPIVMIMDILQAIGVKENYSHPSPKDRVINIAKSCHGDEISEFWEKSYSLFNI